MPALVRSIILFGLLLFVAVAGAQAQPEPKESKASVTGRVTVDGKPKPGIEVVARPEYSTFRGGVAKDTTDDDGRFSLTGMGAGRYKVVPVARINIVTGEPGFGPDGKVVTLTEGEAVEGIDFALTTGGVITGRVTDAEARPVVDERVSLTRIAERGGGRSHSWSNPSAAETDDRGVYRIYGLSAGRYIVSIGGPVGSARSRTAGGGRAHLHTFHPDVTDEARAKVIEVAAGTEAADVDIKLGPPIRTYAIAGRLIDAETGRAVPNMSFCYGSLGEVPRLEGLTSWRSDDKGEFRIEGLMPGRYTAFAMSEDQSGFYSEPITIVVSEENVHGIELNLLRGASVSGRAVIDGVVEPAVLAKLPQLGVMTFPSVPGLIMSAQPARTRFGADGRFLIRGLRGGKAWLHLINESGLKGFSLLRVERGGVDQHGGIDLAPDEQVTDVRLVIAYGAETLRGQVKVEGGVLPEGARIMVFSRRAGPDGSSGGPSSEVDSRGQFTLEGMTVGDHELTLSVFPGGASNALPPTPPVNQLVRVLKGKETTVILTLNFGAKAGDK